MFRKINVGAIAMACAIGFSASAAPGTGMWELNDVAWQEVWMAGQAAQPGNTFSAFNEDLQLTGVLDTVVASTDTNWDWVMTYKDGALVLANDGLWANTCSTETNFTFAFSNFTVRIANTRFTSDTDTNNDSFVQFELTAENETVTLVGSYSGVPTMVTNLTGDVILSGQLNSVALELGVTARLDIKGGSPVAPINVKSRGVLPVALYGSRTLDVRDIDPESIRLGCTAAPLRWNYTDMNGDGRVDLNLKFATQDVVPSFQNVRNRARVTLTLTAVLEGSGMPVSGSDQVTVLKPGNAFRQQPMPQPKTKKPHPVKKAKKAK